MTRFFITALAALAAALPAGASASTPAPSIPPPDLPLLSLWRDLDAVPTPVAREARRITRGMSRYGSEPTDARVLACMRRPGGRLPWRCLSRFTVASGGHCDVVSSIGRTPMDIRRLRHGRVRYVRTVYLHSVTAQRFRVVYGGCGA